MSTGKERIQKTLKSNFTQIPNKIMDLVASGDISVTAMALWCYLYRHSESWEPSTRQIADALNCKRDTVSKALENLKFCNIIKQHKTKYKQKIKLELLPIECWLDRSGPKNGQDLAQKMDTYNIKEVRSSDFLPDLDEDEILRTMKWQCKQGKF